MTGHTSRNSMSCTMRRLLSFACMAVATHIAVAQAAPAVADTPALPAQTPPAQTPPTAAMPAPDAKPITFDIVSFKPYKPDSISSNKVDLPLDGDFIAYHGQPLQRILYFAYLSPGYFQMSGEPAWVDNDLWDFQAKVAPEDIATWQKMDLSAKRLMVRALLADVLKMKVHDDLSMHPVYDLVVAKGGPKLKEYKPGDILTTPDGKVIQGPVLTWFGPSEMVCQATSMKALVDTMSIRVGRPVIDKTGLTGLYNFTLALNYARQGLGVQGAPAYVDPDAESIFNSIQALGLKLVSSKAVFAGGIVIDHIERPSEN